MAVSELWQATKPEYWDQVWNYRLGSYRVFKKWLSYRESKVLGPGLSVGEVALFSEVARRLLAICADAAGDKS